MAAPAGVNEGLPQEPAKAGQASAEAGPTEAVLAKAGPAEAVETAVPAGAVPAQGGPAEEERATKQRAAAGPADPAEAEAGPAEPAEAEPAEPAWHEEEEARRDVSPLAVVGIIVGVIALVGAAVGVLAIVTHGFRPKTVVTYRPAAAFGLRPGQCLNSGPNALDVTVLSCARPHDAEVFATFRLPDTDWPGTPAVQADASDGCASRFGSYLNPDLATIDLTQEFIYPNRAAWLAGERTVVCEVSATSGQLTGSVRAKG